MNYVFLGSVTSEDRLVKLSGASIPGNKMQLSIIRHLKKNSHSEVSIISVPSVAAFPHDKKIWYGRHELKLENDCTVLEVPFVNVPILKQLMQMLFVYIYSKRYNKSENTLIAFNLYPQVGSPLVALNRRGYRVSSILADLPIDDNYKYRSSLIGIMNLITKKNIKNVNHLIVLNENAIKKFNPDASYIVMEGGIERTNIDCVQEAPQQKNIVYSGRLIDYNGIDRLINAMCLVEDKDIYLDIYGSGPMQQFVEAAAQKDHRIRYFGSVDNKTMIEIQRKAWLLINPRPVNDQISQVTFPSKMFEYLTSGVPVLTTKLSGFTAEYDNLMYYCEADTPEGIAEGIKMVSTVPLQETRKRAEHAKAYIEANKNWDVQAKRMIEFLEGMP